MKKLNFENIFPHISPWADSDRSNQRYSKTTASLHSWVLASICSRPTLGVIKCFKCRISGETPKTAGLIPASLESIRSSPALLTGNYKFYRGNSVLTLKTGNWPDYIKDWDEYIGLLWSWAVPLQTVILKTESQLYEGNMYFCTPGGEVLGLSR